MSEQELLKSIGEIDKLLGRCTCPALTRDEHLAILHVVEVVVSRVKLSYKQEEELKKVKEDKQAV